MDSSFRLRRFRAITRDDGDSSAPVHSVRFTPTSRTSSPENYLRFVINEIHLLRWNLVKLKSFVCLRPLSEMQPGATKVCRSRIPSAVRREIMRAQSVSEGAQRLRNTGWESWEYGPSELP